MQHAAECSVRLQAHPVLVGEAKGEGGRGWEVGEQEGGAQGEGGRVGWEMEVEEAWALEAVGEGKKEGAATEMVEAGWVQAGQSWGAGARGGWGGWETEGKGEVVMVMGVKAVGVQARGGLCNEVMKEIRGAWRMLC